MEATTIEFLKNLQNELNTQETDIQANPRFWVVAQYEWHACWEDQAQSYEYCDGESSYNNFDELMKSLKDNNYFDEEGNFNGLLEDYEDIDDFHYDSIHEYENLPETVKEEYYEVPVKEVHVIKENTMFLTKRECQEHIERNHYHYNDTVHTYAMTAWRSPQVEKLIKILQTENFGEVK
jgi:hypothetical protein